MKNPNKYLADFHFVTIGGSISLSQYVADFVKELERRNISYSLHAFGTNIEAERDEIFGLTNWLFDYLFDSHEKRVMLDLKITTRSDKYQSLEEKVKAVNSKLERHDV